MKNYQEVITEAKKGSGTLSPAAKNVITRAIAIKTGYFSTSDKEEVSSARMLGLEVTNSSNGTFSIWVDNSDSRRLSELSKSGAIPQERLPKNIHITNRIASGGFSDEIAVLKQKTAKSDQWLFPVDSHDMKEFGKGLKPNEVLVRVSTPLSKNSDKFNRSIAKINVKMGKLTWVDNEAYEEGTLKWERPYKLDFLTIRDTDLDYFGIW